MDMNKLARRVEALVKTNPAHDNLHHNVCSQICDEFECWDGASHSVDALMIPKWVMYIVSGEMREQGIGA